MRVDVIVSDIHQPVFFSLAREVHAGLDSRERGFLRTENDVVNLTLARRKFAVSRNGARDVRGIAGVLCADVHHYDVAISNLARQLVVVQGRRIRPCPDNRRIALSF